MEKFQQKIVDAVIESQKGSPINDFLSDEEIESAISILADILISTGIIPTEDQ